MVVFKSKWFARFARKERIADSALCGAVSDAEKGLVDADLGGGVIKQRLARAGAGKSGGYRSIILFRSGEKAFFVFGFAKAERDSITKSELRDFKDLAGQLFGYNDATLAEAVKSGEIIKVKCDKKTVQK